jgi:hypothetical protein
MRLAPRKPLTTRPAKAARQNATKTASLQRLLAGLAAYYRRFESTLPSLREAISTVNKLSTDIASLSGSSNYQSLARDVA